MIRPIDIKLNAAHPELPLLEAVTFTGSPSSVFIRGVPPNCGRWAITAVFVAASFPDGSTTTRAAVQSANGVWVATLPSTATSGRTANGIRIMADGIDENGEAVTGYILGVADFAVASLDVTPAPEPGETSYQMLYFDAVPSVLHKGDVTKIDGVLKFYNGTAWEPFAAPVTLDDAVTRSSANGVKSSGIWAAIWGALAALPTGFTSLYDWCVAQLAGKEPLFTPSLISDTTIKTVFAVVKDDSLLKIIDIPTSDIKVNGKALTDDVTLTGADIAVSESDETTIDAALAGKANKSDVDPLLFAQYYPDGSVKSAAEFTAGIKYDDPDTTARTITVKPFCATGDSENDNSGLVGRVVIPPFVDASGNPYISDDGSRFKVVGVGGDISIDVNTNLTAIIAPNTVTTIGDEAFRSCTSLTSASLPAATSIGVGVFYYCTSLAFVDFGDTPRPSVPTLGSDAFYSVPESCTVIVPYTQYDAWIAADGWKDLPQDFVRHAEKADKPATFTTGNLAALDADGNPTDAGWTAGDLARDALFTPTQQAGGQGIAVTLADRSINEVAVSAVPPHLTLTFPTATSGKVRDFALRLDLPASSTTTPELEFPQGVTLENEGGEVPEIAVGTTTILYFTETAANKFLVKGETLTAIAQA